MFVMSPMPRRSRHWSGSGESRSEKRPTMFTRIDALRMFVIALAVLVQSVRAIDLDGDGVDDAIDVCCNTPPGIPVDAEGRPWGDIDKDCDVDLTDVAMLQQSFTGPLQPGCCETNNDCPTSYFCQTDLGDCNGPGRCAALPVSCPDIWAPVCGCDGVTYGNECDAHAAGVSVAHDGECPAQCQSNNDCAFTDYCARSTGDCAGTGACTLRPEQCLPVYIPVCGCDGVTYGNSCEAAVAGVSVDYDGVCVPPCQDNNDCSVGHFCLKDVGSCNGTGTCEAVPASCPDLWDPVCGCDGITYGNDCDAHAAGVSVATQGECPQPCRDNNDCAVTNFCTKATGDCAGTGVCTPRPDLCTPLYVPVCGCDGNTYGNDCEAAVAGVSVAHSGTCGAVPCLSDNDCAVSTFCMYATGACGGSGTCEDVPPGCPDVWIPVCGCDGVTYGNSCEAAAARMSIAADGVCPP